MSSLKKFGSAALTTALFTLVSTSAFAAEEVGANAYTVKSWAVLGAAIAIGLAVLGGTLSQGRAATSALEGIARNPGAASRIQTPMILGLALIESLVLLGFVIAFLLQAFATK